MGRTAFLRTACAAAALVWGAGNVQAQDGDPVVVHRDYQFLPRFSTMNQSGGFGGFDVDMTIRGRFGLDVYRPDAGGWGLEAKFVEVKAGAHHPILAYVENLDRVLGLSGLDGKQLPVAGPLDVFQFTGKTFDGSAANIYATLAGPWIYLRGGTTPPPNTADVHAYRIHALARSRPWADFDDSGAVTPADAIAWSERFGDADDQALDGGAFLAWQTQLGEAPPSLAPFDAAIDQAIAAAGTAVPEPSGVAAVAWVMAVPAMMRKRRCRASAGRTLGGER